MLFDLEIDSGQLEAPRHAGTTHRDGRFLRPGLEKTWAAQGTYWAFVKPLTGRELVDASNARPRSTSRS